MRIPLTENRVQRQPQGSINPPNVASAPLQAFGTQVNEANQKLGGAIEQVGEALGEHIIRQQRADQEAKVLENETNYRREIQDLLSSPDLDKDGKPVGVLNRQLAQAQGATTEFDSKATELKNRYVTSANTPFERAKLSESLDHIYSISRDNVIAHEARQRNESYKNILNSNLQERILNAGQISNPKDLLKAIDDGYDTLYAGNNQLGKDGATTAVELSKFSEDIIRSSLGAMVSPDPAPALAYLDATKSALTPTQYDTIKKDVLTQSRQMKNLLKADKDEADKAYQNELYLETVRPLNPQDRFKLLARIDSDLQDGRIDYSFHRLIRNRALNVNDDPEIPREQKTSKRAELLEKFKELGGKVYKDKPEIKKPLSRKPQSDIDKVKDFRDMVIESASYLTKDEEKKFMSYTQDAANNPRTGLFWALWDKIKSVPNTTKEEETKTMTESMDKVLDPNISVEDAAANAHRIGEEHAIKRNPNRAKYKIGQIVTNPNGISAEVIGYDDNGNPRFKVKK